MHLLVASYLGYKAPTSASSEESDQAMQQLMASMPVQTDAPKLDNSAWDAFVKEPRHV
ncbi:MAG: hypothetical protein ABI433_01040 [Burkholderiaceae bacterium]